MFITKELLNYYNQGDFYYYLNLFKKNQIKIYSKEKLEDYDRFIIIVSVSNKEACKQRTTILSA